jgi:hypothetical protein
VWQAPTPSSVTDSHTGEAEGDTTEEPPVSDKKALAIAAAWGGCYTYALAERLKNARPLHWVQAHPDDVATQNFLAGAGADSFRNLGDYDVVELRAIYAACPEKFQLDSSGAVWKSSSELGYAWTFVNLHAIEQTQLQRQRRVDGVGRPKFDFHTGPARRRRGGGSSSSD